MNKLLGFVIVLFVAILIFQWSSDGESESEKVAGNNAPAAVIAADNNIIDRSAAPPLVNFEDVVQRPLFIEGRRPPPEPENDPIDTAPQSVLAPSKRPVVDLTAILIINGEQYAVFRTPGKKQDSQKLKVGEELDGWKVVKIEPKQVTLNQGATDEVFLLREYKKVPLPVISPNPPVKKAGKRDAEQQKDGQQVDAPPRDQPGT